MLESLIAFTFMNTWDLKKKIDSKDGRRSFELRVSPNGKLFRFFESVWTAVDEEEKLYHPDGGYWTCSKMSGYYASLEECDEAARAQVVWLVQLSL